MGEDLAAAPAANDAGAPAATILIPTFNRAGQLVETLAHLERQTRRDFEVIVVDDGSRDDTLVRLFEFAARSPLAITVLAQANAGPAAARNRGIAAARAPVVMLIGDDTYPEPGFVEAHVALHEAEPRAETVAIGWTRWHKEERATRLMRWLDMDGVQFAYRELLAGEPIGWKHFYTSNLSAKTAYLKGHPFNTRFPLAAWEDIELGLRLATGHGLDMRFLPTAVVRHDHPMTVASACRRAVGVGEGRRLMAQLWPEQFGWRRQGVVGAIRRFVAGSPLLTRIVVRLATPISAVRCPNPLLRLALAAHDDLGYARAEARAGTIGSAQTAARSLPEGMASAAI